MSIHGAERGAASWGPAMGPLRQGESRYRDLPILKRCLDCDAPLEWFEVMTQVRDGHAVTPLCPPCARPTVAEDGYTLSDASTQPPPSSDAGVAQDGYGR